MLSIGRAGSFTDWSDAIQDQSGVPISLVVGAEHLALIAQSNPAVIDNGMTLFIFENSGGRLVEQYEIGPLANAPQAEHAVRLGGGLVLPVGGQTLVIPPAQVAE